jgi:hypothetical protein
VEIELDGPVIEWRGPAPYVFVEVPEQEADEIAATAAGVTYGWGMVPARVTLGETTWTTSLWPREGGYVVPVKVAVQRAEDVEVGQVVTVRLAIDV